MRKVLMMLFCLSMTTLTFAKEDKVELTKLELKGKFKKVPYGTLFIDEKGEEFILLKKPHSELETVLAEQVSMRVKVKQGENRRQIVYIASYEVID
jgi:hypothetical protein